MWDAYKALVRLGLISLTLLKPHARGSDSGSAYATVAVTHEGEAHTTRYRVDSTRCQVWDSPHGAKASACG